MTRHTAGCVRQRLAAWLPWLITALALALRLWRLDAQSLWADEGNSAVLALRSWGDIAQAAAADIHPPLYYWLLNLWVRLVGLSESGLRSLSAVAAAATVGLTFALGRRLYGRNAGLLAAFLLAIAPLHTYYAQEARMYALLTLWGAALALAFVAYQQREDEQRPIHAPAVAYVVSAVLGLYTHYLFPILLAVIAAIYLARLLRAWPPAGGGRRLTRWLLLHLAIALAYLPWAGVALARMSAWPAPAASAQGLDAILAALRWLAFGPAGAVMTTVWFWPFALILAAGLLSFPARAPGGGVLPVAWLLAPIALMLALDLFKDAYLKFLLLASPPLALILARGLLWPWQRLRASPAARLAGVGWMSVGLLGLSAGALLGLSACFTDPRLARDDYRSIAQAIQALATLQDVILLDAPGQRDVFGFYDRSGLPLLALPAERPPLAGKTIAALAEGVSGKRRVFALFWATGESDPQRLVETWLDQNAYKVQDVWRGNVRFVIYSLPQAAAPMQPLSATFAPLTDLTGLALSAPALPSGEVLEITLRWQTLGVSTQRYKVFIQLLDGANQVWAQRDAEPAGESRPTSTWQPGEVIEDRHGLLIPPGTPLGRYRLIAGLYDAATGVRLRTSDADFVDLGFIEVTRPDAPWPRAAFTMQIVVDRQFHDVILLGYNRYPRGFSHAPETPLRRGDILHLDLFWQAVAAPMQGQQMTVSLAGPAGAQVVSQTGPLASAGYPSSQWQPGEIVRGQLDLPLPADLPAGTYRMVMHAPGTIPIAGADIGMVKIE